MSWQDALMIYTACGAVLVLVVLFFGFMKAETKIDGRSVPSVIVYIAVFVVIFALWPYALVRLLTSGGKDKFEWGNDGPPSNEKD
jgi:hypothetical protein